MYQLHQRQHFLQQPVRSRLAMSAISIRRMIWCTPPDEAKISTTSPRILSPSKHHFSLQKQSAIAVIKTNDRGHQYPIPLQRFETSIRLRISSGSGSISSIALSRSSRAGLVMPWMFWPVCVLIAIPFVEGGKQMFPPVSAWRESGISRRKEVRYRNG